MSFSKSCKKEQKKFLTYISLFSGAGIGCYGFKQEDYKCIATCEFLTKRLNIQKSNKKCKFETGYICGDLTNDNISNKIFDEINKWNLDDSVDVVIATPPCQGISVANQKKKNELKRNSLVVKAIDLIKKIEPKVFIFENVSRFLKTVCTGIDLNNRLIGEEIDKELSYKYSFTSKIINFKNYGSNSSRTRCIVIGVRNDLLSKISPFELFPDFQKEKTLLEVIGKYKSLNKMGEYDEDNILHYFKEYDKKMLPWIENLKEGQSAFENKEKIRIPHRIVNGKFVKYASGFGDKYKRQIWNKVAPCIHTANDCLASQNTIHPKDNRVFSIAELMDMMTIPSSFKWDSIDINTISKNKKIEWLKNNQFNIRKSIGESVPTIIFRKIAKNIKNKLLNNNDIYKKISEYELRNPNKYSEAAYFTDKQHLTYIYNILPNFKKDSISILEPSVGGGSFLLPIIKKYQDVNNVNLYLNDISNESLKFCKEILNNIKVPKNFNICFINKDFTKFEKNIKFDLVIGNPPFKKNAINSKNLFEIFWEKSISISKNIIFINPKFLLSSTNYEKTRNLLSKQNLSDIIDFGEIGFNDAKIETIAISIKEKKSDTINIYSITNNLKICQYKKYIFDTNLPYWIIYRNSNFDKVYNSLQKNIFSIKKNYEISNKLMKDKSFKSSYRVLRSKNIDINEPKIINIKNYDRYISLDDIKNTSFFKYINESSSELFLIPNLTYYPRIIRMPSKTIVNGSILVAELIDKNIKINDDDLKYYYSNEFREFYLIGFNLSTRTLNIDKNTINFFGIRR